MTRGTTLGLVAAASLLAMMAAGLYTPRKANVLGIEKVKDRLYVITGGGGNTTAYISANGVVLVDTKWVGRGPAILDALKTVTDKPVTCIINTHSHLDHVGSNEFFPAAVEIVAQEHTKANMRKMPRFADPDKAHGLPDVTFRDRLTLFDGNDTIDLYYFGRGHTDGDAFVVFRALRTMAAGDIFAGKGLPILDIVHGGSGVEIGETLRKAAAGITNVDTVITGHSGTVMTWADFLDYGEFNRTFLSAVQAAADRGETAEQIVNGLTMPRKFKSYSMNGLAINVDKILAEIAK